MSLTLVFIVRCISFKNYVPTLIMISPITSQFRIKLLAKRRRILNLKLVKNLLVGKVCLAPVRGVQNT